jgi:hypothetical protein
VRDFRGHNGRVSPDHRGKYDRVKPLDDEDRLLSFKAMVRGVCPLCIDNVRAGIDKWLDALPNSAEVRRASIASSRESLSNICAYVKSWIRASHKIKAFLL